MHQNVKDGTKKIVVIGAGYAGLHAAQKLNKKLGGKKGIEIILIDKQDRHIRLTEIHEVAGGRVEPEAVTNPISNYCGRYVKFIQDTVKSIDFDEKTLNTESSSKIKYDKLVIAVGSQPEFFGIGGMEKHAFTLWSLGDAITIKNHIIKMFELASKEKDKEKRKELLTFVVGGGGFTGVEMIGELIYWVEPLCRKHNISRKEVLLILVEALPKILPNLRDGLARKAWKFMENKGVKILTNCPITGVEADRVNLKDREPIKTKTLIWSGGVRANDFCATLGLKTGKRNRIEVNRYLQVPQYPDVYAIGDCCWFITEDGSPLPALVEAGMQAAQCAAENIAAQIKGGNLKEFRPNLHGVMVSIGNKYAVADVMGLAFSGVFAMWFKHFVNMHYLFEVGGFGLVKEYISHQFFSKHYKA